MTFATYEIFDAISWFGNSKCYDIAAGAADEQKIDATGMIILWPHEIDKSPLYQTEHLLFDKMINARHIN